MRQYCPFKTCTGQPLTQTCVYPSFKMKIFHATPSHTTLSDWFQNILKTPLLSRCGVHSSLQKPLVLFSSLFSLCFPAALNRLRLERACRSRPFIAPDDVSAAGENQCNWKEGFSPCSGAPLSLPYFCRTIRHHCCIWVRAQTVASRAGGGNCPVCVCVCGWEEAIAQC